MQFGNTQYGKNKNLLIKVVVYKYLEDKKY